MKKTLNAFLAVVLVCAAASAGQTPGGSPATQTKNAANANAAGAAPAKKRGPVFRATKEQIKQAQAILRRRNFYSGEPTGKLDADTRAGLKKYQEAETIKVTGTLNRATLERMNIPLTDRQKAM